MMRREPEIVDLDSVATSPATHSPASAASSTKSVFRYPSASGKSEREEDEKDGQKMEDEVHINSDGIIARPFSYPVEASSSAGLRGSSRLLSPGTGFIEVQETGSGRRAHQINNPRKNRRKKHRRGRRSSKNKKNNHDDVVDEKPDEQGDEKGTSDVEQEEKAVLSSRGGTCL